MVPKSPLQAQEASQGEGHVRSEFQHTGEDCH